MAFVNEWLFSFPLQLACMNMKKFSILFLALFWCSALVSRAATVDTLSVYSKAMQKETRCVVIVPKGADANALPVLYLLHGLGGDHHSWLQIKPELPRLADEMQMLIVCPNGGVRSWYLDSPIDSSFRYETYMIHELIPYIDSHFSTVKTREGRAIAGLSMGGHGSLFLAIRHSEVFGAACSTSGSVDLLKKTFSWKYKEMILGDTICCKENWVSNSVMTIADELQPGQLALHIDCGTEDDLYMPNKRLHEKWGAMGIEHAYIEGPGRHDAAYWNRSIDSILLFVQRFFEKK
jgi:S-formylglutathione hydrolase FrmB